MEKTEKPHRMAQVYGYIVCLVAVITFIICLANIIPSIIDLGDPLHSANMFNPQGASNLASFEIYKMDLMKSSSKNESAELKNFIPDDATIKAMYEAAKADKIQTSLHIARRSIIVNGLVMLTSIILFISHWIWMRRLVKKEVPVMSY